MTTINPLANFLNTVFTKMDRNKDGRLDFNEYQSFYEVLKPGLPVDEDGNTTVTANDCFMRMDANRDDGVTRTEVQTTGVIMPAALCSDGSLEAMIEYLTLQISESAAIAASMLMAKDDPAEAGRGTRPEPSDGGSRRSDD